MDRIISLTIVVLIVSGSVLTGQIIYVNPTASGANTGLSWNDAFSNLQVALSTAEYGNEIWIVGGVYYPTQGVDRAIYFNLKNGVAIYGGFEGDETTKEQRDWETNETILSGNIGEPFDFFDNSYTVLYSEYCDTTTIIDGIIIEEGHANGPSNPSTFFQPETCGGGYYVRGNGLGAQANPKIENCIFRDNHAQWEGGGVYYNGREEGAVGMNLLNCHFINNSCTNVGGAIHKQGGSIASQTMIIQDCNFENNSAFISGAVAISNTINSSLTEIRNCNFNNNYATGATGALNYSDSFIDTLSFVLSNCQFNGNTGLTGIGALSLTTNNNKYLIHNCEFNNNNGGYLQTGDTGSPKSGAVFVAYNGDGLFDQPYQYLEIRDCIFDGNASDGGGAIYNNSFNVKMLNCILKNNIAGINGGAIYYEREPFYVTNFEITNSTFYNNNALERGGSFYFEDPWGLERDTLRLYNSIFWENEASQTAMQFAVGFTHIETNNCMVENSSCVDIFTGYIPSNESYTFDCNLDVQYQTAPLFLDTLSGNLRLDACSSGINAGDNNFISSVNTDLEGNDRIRGEAVDMGAYEFELINELVNIENVTCHNEEDGMIEVESNGCFPIEYTWHRDTVFGQGLDSLVAGDYIFIAEDANGSCDTFLFAILSPSPIDINYLISDASTASSTDGSIEISFVEGGSLPYFYEWSTGDTTTNIYGLPSGNYQLTLSDANGCSEVFDFLVDFSLRIYEDQHLAKMKLSPNPVSITLNVELYTDSERIEIFSTNGNLIFEKRLSGAMNSFNVDVSSFPSGVYYCRLHTNTFESISKRIVVSR